MKPFILCTLKRDSMRDLEKAKALASAYLEAKLAFIEKDGGVLEARKLLTDAETEYENHKKQMAKAATTAFWGERRRLEKAIAKRRSDIETLRSSRKSAEEKLRETRERGDATAAKNFKLSKRCCKELIEMYEDDIKFHERDLGKLGWRPPRTKFEQWLTGKPELLARQEELQEKLKQARIRMSTATRELSEATVASVKARTELIKELEANGAQDYWVELLAGNTELGAMREVLEKMRAHDGIMIKITEKDAASEEIEITLGGGVIKERTI